MILNTMHLGAHCYLCQGWGMVSCILLCETR